MQLLGGAHKCQCQFRVELPPEWIRNMGELQFDEASELLVHTSAEMGLIDVDYSNVIMFSAVEIQF